MGKPPQQFQKLGIRDPFVPFQNDRLRCGEIHHVHHSIEGLVTTNPHLGRIPDPFLLQLVGDLVVHVVPNIFLVGEHLVDHPSGPISAQLRQNPGPIEFCRDLPFVVAIRHK